MQRKNGNPHPPSPAGEPSSPEQATRQAVAAVFQNLKTIVGAMISKAAEGSHLHAKLLFDLAGISAASLPPEAAGEPHSLAELLIQKLDQMAEEAEPEENERLVE